MSNDLDTQVGKQIVQSIMDRTKDAYSRDRYGEKLWRRCVQKLLLTYSVEQTEWILFSKFMRHNADYFETSRGIPLNFIDLSLAQNQFPTRDEIDSIIVEDRWDTKTLKCL
jgi:hypothetical protein